MTSANRAEHLVLATVDQTMSEGSLEKMSHPTHSHLHPLADVLRQFIGHTSQQDYTVSDTRCPYCLRDAGPVTEVFVEATRKWSTQRVCGACFTMIQQSAATWLAANTSPIFCNSDALASQFAKRHARKTTQILVTDFESHGAAA